jgi:hypothetical protein
LTIIKYVLEIANMKTCGPPSANHLKRRNYIYQMITKLCGAYYVFNSKFHITQKEHPQNCFAYFIYIMKYRIVLEAIYLNNKRIFTLDKQIVRILVFTVQTLKNPCTSLSKSLKISSLHCKFIFSLIIFLQVTKKSHTC